MAAVSTLAPESFHWGKLDATTKRAYINADVQMKLGHLNAWHPSRDFQQNIWYRKILPKLLDVFTENQASIFWPHRPRTTVIDCLMTSEAFDWATAVPTVIASSTKLKYARKIAATLQNSELIKRLELGFKFFANPSPTDTKPAAASNGGQTYQARVETLCGARLIIMPSSTHEASSTKHATLGGLLKIDGHYHGITAAHAFIDDESLTDDSDFEEDGETLGNMAETAHARHNRDRDPIGARYAANVDTDIATMRRDARVYLNRQPSVNTSSIQTQDAVHRMSEDLEQNPALELLAMTASAGEPAPSYSISPRWDWALFRIDDPELQLPNFVNLQERTIDISGVSDAVPTATVAVASGFSGTYVANGTGSAVGLLLPGFQQMVPAWAFDRSSCEYSFKPSVWLKY